MIICLYAEIIYDVYSVRRNVSTTVFLGSMFRVEAPRNDSDFLIKYLLDFSGVKSPGTQHIQLLKHAHQNVFSDVI